MTQRFNFSELTNLGGIATPSLDTDAVNKAYVDGASSGTLQGLSDVNINEQTVRTSSGATTSGAASNTSVLINSATDPRTVLTTGVAIFPSSTSIASTTVNTCTLIFGTLYVLTFQSNVTIADWPSGSTIYYNTGGIPTGDVLTWDAVTGKWLAQPSQGLFQNGLGLDEIAWTDNSNNLYVAVTGAANRQNAVCSFGPSFSSFNFQPNQAFTAGFVTGVPVIGTDNRGRMVSGKFYAASGATNAGITDLKFDSTAGGGFVDNQAYTLTFRVGTPAFAQSATAQIIPEYLTSAYVTGPATTPAVLGISQYAPAFSNVGVGTTIGDGTGYNYTIAATNASLPLVAGNYYVAISADLTQVIAGIATNTGTVATLTGRASTLFAASALVRFNFYNARILTAGAKTYSGTADPTATTPTANIGDIYFQTDAATPTQINQIWYKLKAADPGAWLKERDLNNTRLDSLTDVSVTEGLGIDGLSLIYNNATSKWIASRNQLANLEDVTFGGASFTYTQQFQTDGTSNPVTTFGPWLGNASIIVSMPDNVRTALSAPGTRLTYANSGDPLIFTVNTSLSINPGVGRIVFNEPSTSTWGNFTPSSGTPAPLYLVTGVSNTITEGQVLTYDATQDKWTARTPTVGSLTELPFDVSSWANANQVEYVADTNVPVATGLSITTPDVANLRVNTQWTLTGTATIPSFNDGSEILLTDDNGRTVAGVYVAGDATTTPITPAVINQINYDRVAGGGFVRNTTYTGFTARQGTITSSAIFWNGSQGAAKVIRVNTDTTMLNSPIGQNQVTFGLNLDTERERIDFQIADKIGSIIPNLGTQMSTSTQTLVGPNMGVWTISIPNNDPVGTALQQFNLMTGRSETTLPTTTQPPQAAFAYVVVDILGVYSSVAQIANISVPLAGSSIHMTLTANSPNIFNNTVQSNQVYYGNSEFPDANPFFFQPEPAAEIQVLADAQIISDNLVQTITSVDGSVSVTTSAGAKGQIVNLRTVTQPSGAGTATGFNQGGVNYNNSYFFLSAGNTTSGTTDQGNEGTVYILPYGGLTNNPSLLTISTGTPIASQPTLNAWKFNTGTGNVASAQAQVAVQGNQYFRLGVSGSWTTNRSSLFLDPTVGPTFYRVGGTYATFEDQFPGFVNATNQRTHLNPTESVVTTMYFSGLQGTVIGSEVQMNNATGVNSPGDRINVSAISYYGGVAGLSGVSMGQSITIPADTRVSIEAPAGMTIDFGGLDVQRFYGTIAGNTSGDTTKFDMRFSSIHSIPEALTVDGGYATLPGINSEVVIPGGSKIIFWQNASTLLATLRPTWSTLSQSVTGYVEQTLNPNVWTLGSSSLNPTGFSFDATNKDYAYSFNWDLFTPGSTCPVNSVAYATTALSFNNLITVNVPGSGATAFTLQQTLDAGNTAVENATSTGSFSLTSATSNLLFDPSGVTLNGQKLVSALGGTTNIGGAPSLNANGTINIPYTPDTNYETGYRLQAFPTGNNLIIYKNDGTNATTLDYAVGDGIVLNSWDTTLYPSGTDIITAVNTVAGHLDRLQLTMNNPMTGRTSYIGTGVSIAPKIASYNFPFISTANNGVGLYIGNGLSLDSLGKLQVTAVSRTWSQYALQWSTAPVFVSAGTDPANYTGSIYSYTGPYGTAGASQTVYRFVPNTYSPGVDAFYTTLTGSVVSNVIVTRSS